MPGNREAPHNKVAEVKDKEKEFGETRNRSELYETLSKGVKTEKQT